MRHCSGTNKNAQHRGYSISQQTGAWCYSRECSRGLDKSWLPCLPALVELAPKSGFAPFGTRLVDAHDMGSGPAGVEVRISEQWEF